MTAIISAAVIFVVFAVGDMISAKTKAIVSMLLVASVVFLAGFWTGIFPTTMFADSTLLSMAGLLVTMLLVHLGTTIKLRDFGAQWRTVIISAAVFFLGQLIIDRGFALVGAPILSGGVVATLTMQDMAQKANLPELAVFATLVMCAQGFVGYPVASLCLKSEAKRIKAQLDAGELKADVSAGAAQAAAAGRKKLIPALPDKYNTPNAIIASDDNGAPLGAEITQLDGGAQMHQQHGHQQSGHAQQRGIGEHGGGENAGPEACQKDNGGHQQHGNNGFCFGGDHVSDGEHHEDDRSS